MPDIFERARAINDDYRTAAMSRLYYACRLRYVRRINLAFELTIAIAGSATIATWNIWTTGILATLWKILGATAAVLAVIKPLANFSKRIERYSALVADYGGMFFDLDRLILEMKADRNVSDELWARFLGIHQRTKGLGIRDDPVPRKRLHRKCFETINIQIPATFLWWPEEMQNGERSQR